MAPSPPSSSTLISLLQTLSSAYETQLLPLIPQPFSSLLATFNPFPPLLSLTSSITNSQSSTGGAGDIWSLVLLVITLYMTFKVADYVRRSIFGWIWFGIKMAMLLGVVQVVLYVKMYGWERTVRDAGWWSGVVWRYVEGVLEGDRKSSWSKSGRGGGGRGGGVWNTAAGGRGWR